MAIRYGRQQKNYFGTNMVDFQAWDDSKPRWAPSSTETAFPGVRVSLTPGREVPNFGNELEFDPDTGSFTPSSKQSDSGESRTGTPSTELFQQIPAEITAASSNRETRHLVPKTLAMAYNYGKKQYGQVTYGNSLSKHSSPLAQRGVKSGFLTPNADNEGAEVSNSLDFANNHTVFPINEVDKSEVGAAQDTVRAFLGRNKAPKPKAVRGQSQFEQMNLGL